MPLFTLQTEGQIMKFNQRRQLAQVALFSLIALGAGTVFAQATGEKPTDPRGSPCPCPQPFNVQLVKNSGATSPVVGEFSSRPDIVPRINESPYNGTVVNKFFADTLQWKVPTSKTCELKGQVTIKLKNLGTGLSFNDTTNVFANGVSVPGMSLGPSAVWASNTAGQTRTLTYQLTSDMMLSGRFSFVTQDDTAVQEIRLEIQGCCINPTR